MPRGVPVKPGVKKVVEPKPNKIEETINNTPENDKSDMTESDDEVIITLKSEAPPPVEKPKRVAKPRVKRVAEVKAVEIPVETPVAMPKSAPVDIPLNKSLNIGLTGSRMSITNISCLKI